MKINENDAVSLIKIRIFSILFENKDNELSYDLSSIQYNFKQCQSRNEINKCVDNMSYIKTCIKILYVIELN